jgi:hypothetical protein
MGAAKRIHSAFVSAIKANRDGGEFTGTDNIIDLDITSIA